VKCEITAFANVRIKIGKIRTLCDENSKLSVLLKRSAAHFPFFYCHTKQYSTKYLSQETKMLLPLDIVMYVEIYSRVRRKIHASINFCHFPSELNQHHHHHYNSFLCEQMCERDTWELRILKFNDE
jgi:hypothetical protein